MQPPKLEKPIPSQIVNERASYGPFDLKDYIKSADESPVTFQAELKGGQVLPRGLICTSDGILTGIPAKETQGNYKLVINAKNDGGDLQTEVDLTIKPSLITAPMDFADQLKSQVWQALEKGLTPPDLSELLERPVTPLDIHYLLERWGTLTIWDAYNLDPPSEKILLNLEGVSEHYNVYDRGSCMVATPKDLFSYERTAEDGLKTARAMAKEVYNRGWTIQMAGFYQLMRATWVEIQQLIDENGKVLEVINFTPQVRDLELYHQRRQASPKLEFD